VDKELRCDLDDIIYRIKLFRRLIQPCHTAFKTKRGRSARHLQRERNTASKGDKPPPARAPLRGLFNAAALKAVDLALWRKANRFFSALWHSVGCRSPPLLKFGFPKFQMNGGERHVEAENETGGYSES